MNALSTPRKRLVALALATALAIAFLLVAVTQGLGMGGVPEGEVAHVSDVDEGISEERYDRALEQSAARFGLEAVPEAGDEQFTQVNDDAMRSLLLAIWAEGEVADRGIEVSEDDVQSELDQVVEGFRNEREFQRVVRQAKFCTEEEIEADVPAIECGDVVRQGRLLALQRALNEAFTVTPEVGEEDIESFYEANLESFEVPASRDVRQIVHEDEEEVEAARAELEGVSPGDEGFARAWNRAARSHSQDQATKDRDGLLEGFVAGQGDAALSEQIFGAAVGELVGPFETPRGFALIQVVEERGASTQSLEEAREGIEQQLLSVRQQAGEREVQQAFLEKWTRRTACADEVMMEFCRGFEAPAAATVPGQPEPPAPPAVQPATPITPGTSSFSPDGSVQTGPPQRPKAVGDECATEEEIEAAGGQTAGVVDPCGPDELAADEAGAPPGLPQDAIPIGPDGAPPAP